MIKTHTLPAVLRAEGEYYTTLETWMEILDRPGFQGTAEHEIPPGGFGLDILEAGRRQGR